MENEIQQNIPPVQPLPQTPSIVPSSTNWLKILLFVVLGLAVVAGSVFIGIQIGKNQTSSQQQITVQPTVLPTQTVTNPTTIPISTTTTIPTINPTSDWQVYLNTQANFSINYPKGWRKVESANWAGFGPQEVGEDVVWGVSFYNKSEKTATQIKDDIGKQFPDRKQIEETVTNKGQTAIKVVTTTNQYADWYSVTIIVDSGNMLYAIGNGAQTDTSLNQMILKRTGKEHNLSFENFYSSFKIIK